MDDRRTWRVPPAPYPADAVLEGIAILQEIPGDLGAALWLALRSITLWATTRSSDRSQLFSAHAWRARKEEIAELDVTGTPINWDDLGSVLERPASVTGQEVARACLQVVTWAEQCGHVNTEAEYAQAAALSDPRDPRLAVEAGRVCRNLSRFAVAEGWFQRGIGLARQRQEWDAYGRGYVGLGKLYFRRGRPPLARKSLERAVRATSRHGVTEVQAMAHHDLFNLAFFDRRFDEGLVHAARAAQLYGSEHAALPRLAWDVAYQWMEQGEFARAFPFLLALRPAFSGRYGTVADGGLARAAGELGRARDFNRAAKAVRDAPPDRTPDKAAILVDVARGAMAMGRSTEAEELLTEAERLAAEYRETRTLHLVDDARAKARAERRTRLMPFPPLGPAEHELVSSFSLLMIHGR